MRHCCFLLYRTLLLFYTYQIVYYIQLLYALPSYLFHVCFFNVGSKKSIRILGVNVMCVISILIYVEYIFRIEFAERNIPNLYEPRGKYYFNKPFLKETFVTPEYSSIYYTDKYGYRINPCNSPYIHTDTCDILFIGDSFTQGAQVDYNKMFSSIVSDSLPQYKCINAGISGAGICDEYYYYMNEGKNYNAKYILLQIGVFNDFFNIEIRETGYKQKLIEMSAFYRYLYYNINHNLKSKTGRWCEPFFDTKEGNINYNILFKESSPQKERDKQNFMISLKSFNEMVKRNRGELIVCLIPSKEQISTECLREVMNAYNIEKEELDLHFPNRWLKNETAKSDIIFIDLLEPFKECGGVPYFNVDEHMNELGHQIVANEIVKCLKSL